MARPARLRVPGFVVIGGGEFGAFCVRQLLRARESGRLETDRIQVLDRDRACLAAALVGERVRLEMAEWSSWLREHLGDLPPGFHLVPYHWAPHLLRDWLASEATRAGLRVERASATPPQGLPFERGLPDGGRALSYATWTCPPACIEPALCPHTGGAKDWSLAAKLARADPDDAWDERLVFPSLHLVYGVASIPVAAILAARRSLIAGAARGARRYLVSTASHCHGLASVLSVA